MPYWAEMALSELICAVAVGLAVGGIAGDPRRGRVNAALVLFPAILLQGSFAFAFEAPECGDGLFTLIVGSAVFNEALPRYPFVLAAALLIAVAFSFIVLRRGNFATRAIAATLFFLIPTVSYAVFATLHPSLSRCPVI